MDDDEDTETRFWRAAVKALLERGVTPTEAFDGANILLEGFRRDRGTSRGAEPPADRALGAKRKPTPRGGQVPPQG